MGSHWLGLRALLPSSLMTLSAGRGYTEGLFSSRRRRRGIRVICYHGVVERRVDEQLERNQIPLAEFREQIDYLRRFRTYDLNAFLEELEKPARRDRPGVLVTFDDACVNTLPAAEVLAAKRVPWIMFVPTAEVDSSRPLWPVELSLLMLHGEARRVDVLGRRWILSGRDAREAAFQTLRHRIKSMAAGEREQVLACLRAQFPAGESARLLDQFPSFRMLSWSEIGQLAASGVEIGSHGRHHELHHDLQPESVRHDELFESKKEIEGRLGLVCRSFAFPNGDFVEDSAAEVAAAGYAVAFTTENGAVRSDSNRYLLPRLHPTSSMSAFARTFSWMMPHELPAGRLANTVSRREATLDEMLRAGRAAPGLLLQTAARLPDAADPDVEFASYSKLTRVVAILECLVETRFREPRIAHLGCGSGWLTAILGCFGPTVGVALEGEAAVESRSVYRHVGFVPGNLTNWALPRGAFDIVVSHQALEGVTQPDRHLATAFELLRPGGFLVLTTLNARTLYAIPPPKRALRMESPSDRPTTVDDLQRLLLAARFEIKKLRTIAPGHGSLGAYRLANSERIGRVLERVGLGRAFEDAKLARGYGLHLLALARKP